MLLGTKYVPFAKSDVGQFYLELCLATGKTLRELGELKRSDPEYFEFLEEAYGYRRLRMRGIKVRDET